MSKAMVQQQENSLWREDFPIMKQDVNGKPVSFLDSGASAQKPHAVIETMKNVMEGHYANIHRGLYSFSQATTAAFEAVRPKVQGFINAQSENEVIFTRNTTEAINLVAHSWGRQNLTKGDSIILSEMEHHANIVPWQLLAEEIGFTIKTIPVKQDGSLDLAVFEGLLEESVKFLGIVHVSNAFGTLNPVKQMIAKAKQACPGIVTLVDGSQSVVHRVVDVQDLGCDFFCFTGHKLYGPAGVGVLWGKEYILNKMTPYQGGGDMIETVSFKTGTTFKQAPARFEAGTPAIVDVIGLGAAIDYVATIGMANIHAYEQELYTYMVDKLGDISGITLYATLEEKAPVLSFSIDGVHHSDVGMILDQCGVAVRTGHHCCMPLMEVFDIDGTVRASLGLYNNKADIDRLVEAVKKAINLLQ